MQYEADLTLKISRAWSNTDILKRNLAGPASLTQHAKFQDYHA